ncbi:hypothetical protein LL946_10845 [Knoellia locipacati]|uniref:hypothetical protein n=1 Tax=Knoellia locipacati TaxID=882824 RepID=UPI00384ABA8B
MAADGGELDPRSVASLPEVEAALFRAIEDQRARRASLDSKAGLVLGSAGVVVGLRANDVSWLGLFSALVATVSGACAVWALWPAVGQTIDPAVLRRKYIHRDPSRTRLVIIDSHLLTLASGEQRMSQKTKRFRTAAVLLAASIVVSVLGLLSSTLMGKG